MTPVIRPQVEEEIVPIQPEAELSLSESDHDESDWEDYEEYRRTYKLWKQE